MKTRVIFALGIAVVILGTLVAYPGRAAAQDAVIDKTSPSIALQQAQADQTSTTQSSLGAVQADSLQEVVVTARHRSENLQSTPVAVTSIDTAALAKMIPEDLRDIGRYSPNVSIGAVPGFRAAAISIRGVSTGDIPSSFDPSIGVSVDGFFMGAAQSALLDAYDLDRIEILRGPQGTLFGKNTIGGVVNVTTKRPTGDFDGQADLNVGNYGRVDFRGSVDTPIIQDILSGRVAILSQNSDGYDKDAATGRSLGGDDDFAGRAKLLFTPNPDLTALLSFEYNRDRSGTPAVVNTTDPSDAFYNVLLPLASRGVGDNPLGDPHVTGLVPASEHPGIEKDDHDFNIYGVYANVDYDTGFGKLTSISGYRSDRSKLYNDYFGEDIPFYATEREVNRQTVSQEVRFSGTVFNRVDYVAGLYYQDNKFHYENRTSLGPAFTGAPTSLLLFAQGYQNDNSYAAFAEADTHITNNWRLITGVRYSYEDKNFYLKPLGVSQGFQTSDDWHNPTFRVGTDYTITKDVTAYVTYSTGFKSGGYNEQAGDQFAIGPFQQEKATSYEVGIKSEEFDRHLRINLTGFYTTYDKLQLDSVIPLPIAPFQESAITNAGSERVYGLELETVAKPVPDLTITGTGGWLHARYTSFLTKIGGNISSPIVDATFLEPKRSPEFTASLGADYNIESPIGTFTTHLDTTFTSSFYNDTFNSESSHADAVNLWNASVSYLLPDENYTITLWGKNIFDRTYRSSGLDVAGLWGFSTYGPPATFGVELNAKF